MKLTALATLAASQMQFLTIGIQQKNWFSLWLEQHFQIEVTIVLYKLNRFQWHDVNGYVATTLRDIRGCRS
jgi:hypothetical protein